MMLLAVVAAHAQSTAPTLSVNLRGLGGNCNPVGTCGKIVLAQCGPEKGRNLLYVDASDPEKSKVLARCGSGVCKPGWHTAYCAASCPPKAWQCGVPAL